RGAQEEAAAVDAFKSLSVTEPKGRVEGVVYAATRLLPTKAAHSVFSELAGLWRAAKHLLAIPSYRGIVIGLTAGSFASYAIAGFIVPFFARSHPDFARSDVLLWLGLINGTAYVLGVLVGGRLVDHYAKKDKAAYGWIPAIAMLANAPFFLGAMWVSNPVLSLVLWWPSHLLTGFYLGPCFALAQTLAPVSIRALSTAIFFFILNMIALGFGPTYVGIMSDVFAASYGSATGLRIALSTVLVAGFVSIAAFIWLTKQINRDWAQATGEETS
ncbi:MAG: hypothetical protein AAGJ87_11165, partial [Pseudomonadota bacterium]